mgnify:CR=1 FL=1
MTKIAVQSRYSYEEPITIQYFTDEGDLDYCDHAGAEETQMEFVAYSWWSDGGISVPDDSRTELVMQCDKCEAWQDLDGLWRND